MWPSDATGSSPGRSRVSADEIVDLLDRAGLRLTEPRRMVAGLVAGRDGYFTALDLIQDARRGRTGVGRATIFRSLELFEELNVLERLDLPSGDHAYISCEPAHHHHVVCSRCGDSTEVEDCGMQDVAREISRRTGYAVDTHRLELYGLCPRCQRTPDPI